MATFDGLSDCLLQVHFCQPVKTTKKAQANATPVTNELAEMEISGCLCGQIGELEGTKKSPVPLFCFFELSSTMQNINLSTGLYRFITFFRHKRELSNREGNMLDVDFIKVKLHNTCYHSVFVIEMLHNRVSSS